MLSLILWQATKIYKQIIGVQQRMLGNDHPDTRATSAMLGLVLRSTLAALGGFSEHKEVGQV